MPKISALPPMITADAADEAPIVDTSVSTTKKWTLTLLKTYLQSLVSWITTAMVTDDAVTAAKIDWAATGANGGIWWEELGRTTLGVAGDVITVSSLGARKYLRVIIETRATGGTNDLVVTFNGDTGNNYAIRISTNGAADTTSASRANLSFAPSTAALPNFVVMDILNVSTVEKAIFGQAVGTNTAGAATAPERRELVGKWANTSAQISSVTATNGSGTGDFAIGSQVIVLGHN